MSEAGDAAGRVPPERQAAASSPAEPLAVPAEHLSVPAEHLSVPAEPPSPAASPAPTPSSSPAAASPAGPGRARELVGRRRPRKAPDTGRVHHLGAAPPRMPVLPGDPDADATSTRTAAVQLAARTRWELDRLAADLAEQMTAAATALEFERAGQLRNELGRVQAELDRRRASE